MIYNVNKLDLSINNFKETNSKNIKEINSLDTINYLKKIDKLINKDKNIDDKKYELELSNLSFGYNSETKDFFIKVKKGNIESQFPTDDMMKLKANLKELSLN